MWARTGRDAELMVSRGPYRPRVHPQSGANLRRAEPHERRRTERGKNLTVRPGRGARDVTGPERRVRETAAANDPTPDRQVRAGAG